MSETVLFVGAVLCAILYGLGIVFLISKNSHRTDIRYLVVAILLIWPTLFFMSFMQLVIVIPLYTIFYRHGRVVPYPLPPKTAWTAVGTTLVFLAVVVASVMYFEG